MTLNKMNVGNRHGDTEITWDPQDPASIEVAEDMFDQLSEKGYSFFSDGKRLTNFDVGATNIVAVPPMAGG